MQEGRTGEGWEILYDQIVKHGFIICREIKVSQKKDLHGMKRQGTFLCILTFIILEHFIQGMLLLFLRLKD
jgi:hypothetical protein